MGILAARTTTYGRSSRRFVAACTRAEDTPMERNTKRQGAMTWLWIGFAVIIALVALYVLVGLVG